MVFRACIAATQSQKRTCLRVTPRLPLGVLIHPVFVLSSFLEQAPGCKTL